MATPQTIDEKANGAGTAAAAATRRTIATYPDYATAERAVDYLSDQGFAVERTAIVGKDLRSVEQVEGRMSAGRAALVGLGEGTLIGTLFALLFGVFFNGPRFGGLLLYGIVTGGALRHPLRRARSRYGERRQARLRLGNEHRRRSLRGPGRRWRRRRGGAPAGRDARRAMSPRRRRRA